MPKGKPLTRQKKAHLQRMRDSGLTIAQIAKRAKVSVNAVSAHTTTGKPKPTNVDVVRLTNKMQDMRNRGKTVAEIAAELDVTVNFIYEKTTKVRVTNDGKVRKTKGEYTKYTRQQIAQMRDLRARGRTYEEIMVEVGASSLKTVAQYVGDIEPPKKPKEVKLNALRYDQAQRRVVAQDVLRNRHQALHEIDQSGFAPTHFPTGVTWNHTGDTIDPVLVEWALAITRTWSEGVARGNIYDGIPIAVRQATLIWSRTFRPHDLSWWNTNREGWTGIRELAGVSAEEVSERVGVSFASIRRYERALRLPEDLTSSRMQEVYINLLENYTSTIEMDLAYASYIDAHKWEPDDTFTVEELMGHISDGQDIENFDISHLEHLADIRAMLPYPQYRKPTVSNLWLAGYQEQNLLTK